ncbi:MAG: AMP-binding protein [Acidobacteriota bacterium]|nr:AMP-binding protein [Acidobacteriota bacterium]
MLLNEVLTQHAQRHPAKVAVIAGDRQMTFAQLDDAVECMAHSLLHRGLRHGDRIAIHSYNSIEMLVLILGAFRAGLIAVPMNPRMKAPEVAYILQHSGARICFSDPELVALAPGAEAIGALPVARQTSAPLPLVSPDDPAILLYTSGTTARPKGVIHTQRTLFEGSSRVLAGTLTADDIVLATTQLAHVSCLMCWYFPGLIQGASVVMLRSFDPAAALDLIDRHGCTYWGGLPAGLQQIVEEQFAHPRNVSTVRTIVSGGDSLPVAVQRRILELFHVEVRELCGMTEVLPTAFNPPGAVRPGSIGTAPQGCSLRVIDAHGNDVEPGEVGELVLRSPASCLGYWNDPEATASLLRDEWLHTGDLVLCDEDGYYWFKGRLKQIIIRGGSNISPQEVEEVLYQHPAVLEAGVVGLPDPKFGELPVAFVSLRAGRCCSQDDLLTHARRMLSDYKVPTKVYFLDGMPKGLTGKVDRRRLRDILLANAELFESEIVSRV